jgi:hypothetical protein
MLVSFSCALSLTATAQPVSRGYVSNPGYPFERHSGYRPLIEKKDVTFLPLTTPALASIYPALLGDRPHSVELPGGHGVSLGTSTVTG